MKIQKALKLKKRMGADIAKIQSLIQQKNSFVTTETNDYDVVKLLSDLRDSVGDLLRLKSAINTANLPIQATIYTIGEAKSRLVFLKGINTFKGSKASYSRDVSIIYDTVYTERSVAEMMVKEQDFIDELQEKIDTFNYTTEVVVE